MRGSPILPKSRFPIGHAACGLLLFLLLAGGCKAAGGIAGDGKKASTLKEFLLQYEKSFDPSRYELDIPKLTRGLQVSVLPKVPVYTTILPETIPGYRVQILFTKDIDQASLIRDSLDEILREDWVYTEYEPPYYKVRVGNYEDRTPATRTVKRLHSLGFKDAWVVPDNVLRNYPPKPPDVDIEPESPFVRRR